MVIIEPCAGIATAAATFFGSVCHFVALGAMLGSKLGTSAGLNENSCEIMISMQHS